MATSTRRYEQTGSGVVSNRGWPVMVGPLAGWTSTQSPCTVFLPPHEITAIEKALEAFKGLEVGGESISPENFSIPATVQGQLGLAAVDLHSDGGTGICVIRGLDPHRYTDADNLLLFLGLASFLGDRRGVQDRDGNVITHVTDAKSWKAPNHLRHRIHTSEGLSFHTDMGADIVALQVRQKAASGGFTHVASAWAIYNDLVAIPSMGRALETLAEPNWPIQVSGSTASVIRQPLLAYYDDKVMVSFDPGRLGIQPGTRATRPPHSPVPDLTPAQQDALAAVSELAAKHSVRLDARPGDIIFINNWAFLHARDAYVDSDTARRHLLRLWLRNSRLGWKVPDSMNTPWAYAFGRDDTVVQKKFAVVPPSDYKPPKYTAGSAAFTIEDSDESESGEI